MLYSQSISMATYILQWVEWKMWRLVVGGRSTFPQLIASWCIPGRQVGLHVPLYSYTEIWGSGNGEWSEHPFIRKSLKTRWSTSIAIVLPPRPSTKLHRRFKHRAYLYQKRNYKESFNISWDYTYCAKYGMRECGPRRAKALSHSEGPRSQAKMLIKGAAGDERLVLLIRYTCYRVGSGESPSVSTVEDLVFGSVFA